MDLGPLIKGIMAIIGIALATGHYGDLERWARRQAIQALEWKQPLPYFFPPGQKDGRVFKAARHHRAAERRALF